MGTFNQSSSLISIEFNHKIAAMLQASKYFLILFCIYGTSFLFENKLLAQTNPDQPNILLIIADDMGHDITPGFLESARMPNTPTLDSLRNTGLTFTNAWATPQCAPTRAALISGKFGIKTGVRSVPGNLDTIHKSIFKNISEVTNNAYADALIGKWHISNPADNLHPLQHGVDHFEGFITANINDYYSWNKVENNTTVLVEEYLTSHLTTASIDWIQEQTQPWFLWLGHFAPHNPFHLPPVDLFSVENTNNNLGKYIAAIEAMDKETNRLLKSIPKEQLDNTLVIFLGDNGTPRSVLQTYDSRTGKGTLNQAGVNVPLIISGKGVSRKGEVEATMLNTLDIYATLLEVVGAELPGGIYNSKSFKPFLSCGETAAGKKYNYTDYKKDGAEGYAIRNERYKFITYEGISEEFYDLQEDPLEANNLIDGLSADLLAIKAELEAAALQIRTNWSCEDGIRNGSEVNIDDCNEDCDNDNTLSTTNIGCCDSPSFPSIYHEYDVNNRRGIFANTYPSHDFCYNPNRIPAPLPWTYEVTKTPELADQVTSVSRENGRPARFYGVALNGIKFIPSPALPFVFENPNTGEYNWDWVYEANNVQGDGAGLVALDCSSAHTNNSQGYHYHGNMFEYVEQLVPGISTTLEAPQTPLHIGWASDGFPILYRFGPNENNELEELNSSYTLKTGLRPGNGIDAPCGAYSGRYIRDYEFICGKGDLDECNGIQRQLILETKIGLDTFDYFYVITTTYPQVSRCLSGTPSPDFENSVSEYNGPDADNDGYPDIVDCEPNNSAINPGATEIPDNGIDENCDGLDQANVDADGDGFTKENDCDDTNNEIYPGATEICNGLDDNCDGNIDEGFTVIAYFVDADGDGFGDDNAMTEGCMQPPGTSEVGGDCDDQNASINPNGIEIPNNGTDEDCDGEDLTTSIYTLEGNEINVFPNPVSNYLTIEYFGDIEMSFEIYNASANRIMVTPNRIIDLSTISSGVYFLKVKSLKSGKSITHKFIKIQ